MNVRTALAAISILAASPASAAPRSPIGGTPLGSGTAHHVFLGLPSIGYEWWHAGRVEWALGGELVYEDWSGEFSDPDIGFAFNLPLKFNLMRRGLVDVAMRVAPGAMIGFIDRDGGRNRDDDDFVLIGARADLGVLVSVRLSPMVSLVTGGSFPVTFIHVTEADRTVVIIPIYPRIGVDVQPISWFDVWFLFEIGPAICAGDCDEVEAGARVWIGMDFY